MTNAIFLALVLLTSACSNPEYLAAVKKANCDEGKAYETGFNQGKSGSQMSSAFASSCDEVQKKEVVAAYQKGFKEGLASEAAKPVPTVINLNTGSVQTNRAQCSDYKKIKSCFDLDDQAEDLCEVCKDNRGCFSALDGSERNFCEAYREDKTCFMAFDNDLDRKWCTHLKEGKDCQQVFQRGSELTDCLNQKIPARHWFWRN